MNLPPPQPSSSFSGAMNRDLTVPSVDQPPLIPPYLEPNNFSRFDAFLSERGYMPNTISFPNQRSSILPPERAPSAPIIVPPSMSPLPFDNMFGNITEEKRATEEYSVFYHSQRPIDPRLPKPLEPAELTYSFGAHGPRPSMGGPLDLPHQRQSGSFDSDDDEGSLPTNYPNSRIRTVVNSVVNDAIGSFEEKPRVNRPFSPAHLIAQQSIETEASPDLSPISDLIIMDASSSSTQRDLGDLSTKMDGLSITEPAPFSFESPLPPTATTPATKADTIVQPQPRQALLFPEFVPRPEFLKATRTVIAPQQPQPSLQPTLAPSPQLLQQQPPPPIQQPIVPRAFSPVSVTTVAPTATAATASISPSSTTFSASLIDSSTETGGIGSDAFPSWLPPTDVVRSHSPRYSHQHAARMNAGVTMTMPVTGTSIAPRSTSPQQSPYTSAAMEILTTQQMIDQLMPMARDQNGSRFIQMKLESSDATERQILFEAIIPHIAELMCDIFGNYVVQKFYDIGTDEQKRVLCGVLRGRVVEMSKNAYGCRVVQKALETTPRDAQLDMCSELAKEVLPCVTDQNGNHVIQKCIETLPSNLVQFIVDAFLGRAVEMAKHAYGCRVLQRIIEHCEAKQTVELVSELLSDVHDMLTDPFGNYVIQHIMERGLPSQQEIIVNATHMRVVELSKHKFASNVMEKCVEFSDPELRSRTIIHELLEGIPGQQRIFQLVADQYGNYVVQKMLDVCDPATRQQILDVLKPNIAILESLPYGRHILQCMARFDPSIGVYLPASPIRNPRHRSGGSSMTGTPDSRNRGGGSDRISHRTAGSGVPRYLH